MPWKDTKKGRAYNKKYAQQYYKENPEKAKAVARKRKLKCYFGITVEEYDRMLAAQNGVCAICSGINADGKRLAVDHNHETGKLRGLLCHRCNIAIGLLKDSADRARLASLYLIKYGE